MKQQLKLELEKKPEPKKRIHYLDLSIHQKINVKANSCGFQKIWLNHSLTCFKNHVGFINHRDHKPNELSERWLWHQKANKDSGRVYKKAGQLF